MKLIQPKSMAKKSRTTTDIGAKYGFRSGFEKAICNFLLTTGVDFEYEKTRIEYVKPAKKARYTPDFIIRTKPDGTPKAVPLVIETKGRFMAPDRQKHLLLQEQTDWDIRFVFMNPNAKINKGSKTTYADWCERYGFQYAKLYVPKDWLWEP